MELQWPKLWRAALLLLLPAAADPPTPVTSSAHAGPPGEGNTLGVPKSQRLNGSPGVDPEGDSPGDQVRVEKGSRKVLKPNL